MLMPFSAFMGIGARLRPSVLETSKGNANSLLVSLGNVQIFGAITERVVSDGMHTPAVA